MLKCTNAQLHNCQMLKCTNAQTHKCTNAQMHKCSNAQMLNSTRSTTQMVNFTTTQMLHWQMLCKICRVVQSNSVTTTVKRKMSHPQTRKRTTNPTKQSNETKQTSYLFCSCFRASLLAICLALSTARARSSSHFFLVATAISSNF